MSYTRDAVLVNIKGVVKRYGNKEVLSGVDAEIRDLHCSDRGRIVGQCVALVGASGSGKTTLLNIVAGLEPPTLGSVTLDDCKEPVKAGDVGVVFQNYPMFHNRTVIGNIVRAGEMGGLSTSDARTQAQRYLDNFGLTDEGSKYPAELSGGMRQRVALARQLIIMDGPHSSPTRLLLLDEPFSALDPQNTIHACNLIRHVADSSDGTTVMVVTHDLRAALSIADLILVLKKGPTGGGRIERVMDMADRELAWNPEARESPAFCDAERELSAALTC